MIADDPALARESELLNSIPASFVDLAVTDTPAVYNLNALGTNPSKFGVGGGHVRLVAKGADITFLSGDHVADPLVAGAGVVLAADATSERYYVSTGNALLTVVAGSAGPHTLRILYG